MSLPPPPPPPGPGVHPPFPAPPVEGRGKRTGTTLGIVAVVLVLVCGAGTIAAGGFFTAFTSALDEQAQVVVGRYLDDLRERDFGGAYEQLCQDARDTEAKADYVARMTDSEPLRSYSFRELTMGIQIVLPVDLIYVGGDRVQAAAVLGQNTQTGEFEVCELEE
ncbi:hypothetical protein [Actinoplanes utahensis]|uniref:DUF4878 domain-containing protein n=1 Tax=Actinoplanes utahensis TaxID=1869 RepID=A0A0A6UNX0_ACTUT|nr:hypothetical protein [Actinoplanes utahensis]KHD76024.1 hypothetical protein MB27_19260 [Actinoplanes utahensis]GIF34760.1 hypothetical protein Aut01nite_77460 [Actinoplanes utahensis]